MAPGKRKQVGSRVLGARKGKSRKRTAPAEAQADQQPGPFGTLSILPKETLHQVFRHLQAKHLSSLCLVSRCVLQEILAYLSVPSARNRLLYSFLHKDNVPGSSDDVFYDDMIVGFLLKRVTLFKPVKERLKFLDYFTSVIRSCDFYEHDKPLISPNLIHLGKILRIFTLGWSNLDCARVFKYISNTMNLERKLNTMLNSPPGKAKGLEIDVKYTYRQILLDPCLRESERLFWLAEILNPWPRVSKARLLYVLYGPYSKSENRVLWECMLLSDPPLDASLRDLGSIIRRMAVFGAFNWKDCDILNIIKELSENRSTQGRSTYTRNNDTQNTFSPAKWKSENLARFLFQCGEMICSTVLSDAAENRQIPHLATLIVFMSIVCEKDGYNMCWLVNETKKICCSITDEYYTQRLRLKIKHTYKHVNLHLIHSLRDDPDREEELYTVLNAQACFLKEFMSLAFCPVTTIPALRAPHDSEE